MASSSQLEFVTIDVFTSTPYEGNPLAIIRIPPGVTVSQEQKQKIAREFNLSESTFLHERSDDAEDQWTVDIFMTTQELPFAGHPTIGTACYALSRAARERGIQSGMMNAGFRLKAGPVELQYDVVKGTARAAIPHDVRIHRRCLTRAELFNMQPQLAEAHGQNKFRVADDFPVVSIVKGMTFIVIELESLEALASVGLVGQSIALAGLDEGWEKTFVGTYFFVRTGKSDRGAMVVRTRMIEGTLEDPATGSAACAFAAYLSLQEGKQGETVKFDIVQGVEMGRRSEIFLDVELSANNSVSKLYLEGGAVQVMEGRLTI